MQKFVKIWNIWKFGPICLQSVYFTWTGYSVWCTDDILHFTSDFPYRYSTFIYTQEFTNCTLPLFSFICYPLTCVKMPHCIFTSHRCQKYEHVRGWRVWKHRYHCRDSVAKTCLLCDIPGMVIRFCQECEWRGKAV